MAQLQGTGGTVAEVDSDSAAMRARLHGPSGVQLAKTHGDSPGTVEGVPVLGLNDHSLLPFRVDRLGSQAISLHTPVFQDSFEGTTIHPIRWLITATTMAASQASAQGLLINSGAITTINTGYMAQSSRRILKMQRAPLQARFRARLARVNNSVMELGFGDAATMNGANTTGAVWQVTSSGSVQPVVIFNGSAITGADISGLIDPAKFYIFDVIIDDDQIDFVVQDSGTGLIVNRQTIPLPLTGARLLSTSAPPLLARLYITAVAPVSAPQLIVSDAYVALLDANLGKPAADILAGFGRGPADHPFTGAQLAQWANSAEPASATLSNTAAGYTTLGGKFQFAAVGGLATDYALFGFQVPVPANLTITGVDIETWNTGAAVATTPTLLTWALGVGSTAVSLATATVNRIPLGAQQLPVGAAIGAKAERISKQFRTPVPCPSGRFVHLILRMPVATATASQVIAGMATIEGYFE